MFSPRLYCAFSLKQVRLRVVLGLLPLLLGLVLQSFGTAHAQAVESLRLDKSSGPTGDYITVTGTNMVDCAHEKVCIIYLALDDNHWIHIGNAALDTNNGFTWTGVIPRAGDFLGDESGPVEVGKISFIVGDDYSNRASVDFTITDNSSGPFVSWNAALYASERYVRTDDPGLIKRVPRSYLWGPKILYEGFEPYKGSPDGWRYVIYYDKARMEVNDYTKEPKNNPYYVSNGLLVKEMMTNQIQLGDNTFEENTGSPDVLPAGDLTSTNQTPPYRVYASLQNTNDNADGSVINEFLSRTGDVEGMDSYNKYNVTAGNKVDQTGHYIASPFWAYLNTTGPIIDPDNNADPEHDAKLFDPLFSATGLPITEPYWTTTMVGGVNKDVLVQLFERRVLTYTPSNSAAFRVEMGNVGLQYFQWRYGQQ